MASKYLEIVGAIKAVLTALECGKVHTYARITTNWSKYIEFFRDTDKTIRGWEITRAEVPESLKGAYFRHHRMVLRGHLGIQDEKESDLEWQVLLDDICEAFRAEVPTASRTWLYGNGTNPSEAPAQIRVNDQRLFGSVLCHYAEVHLTVTERIIP